MEIQQKLLTLQLSDLLKSTFQAAVLCCKAVPNTRVFLMDSLFQEQELKAAADGVLSEVRKKQADTKRMVDILRALEKLRKLRKEAAARKGNHGFAFLLVFIPLLPCSFLLFTLAPPKFLKEKCLIIFFSPNRVIKLVSSTAELLKQKPQTLFTPLLTRLKREAGVGTHYAAFPLIHHSHPRHSWPRFSE